MNDQLRIGRVRRELAIFKAGYGLTDQEISQLILGSGKTVKDLNRRDGYSSISRHSIKDFLEGSRKTQKSKVSAIQSLLEVKRGFPNFVFESPKELEKMAVEARSFFRAPVSQRKIEANYCVIYQAVSATRKVFLSVLIDYDQKNRILYARGQIFSLNDGMIKRRSFVQGFAILKPDVLMIILRDDLRFDPYIIEFPQRDYSISKVNRLGPEYSHDGFTVDSYSQPFLKVPRREDFRRRFLELDDPSHEFMSYTRYWRVDKSVHERDFLHIAYDVFGGNPLFVADPDNLPTGDRLFDDYEMNYRRFANIKGLYDAIL